MDFGRNLKVLQHHEIRGDRLCFKGGRSVTIPYRVPLPRLLFRTRLASRSASSCLHSESTLGPVDPAGSVPGAPSLEFHDGEFDPCLSIFEGPTAIDTADLFPSHSDLNTGSRFRE